MDADASIQEIVDSLNERISAFNRGDVDQVLDEQSIAEASALLTKGANEDGGIPLAVAVPVAWLHWCRFKALPENDDQADLRDAMQLFAELAKVNLALVPEELRQNWPGGRVTPESEVAYTAAVDLLRAAFDSDDAGQMDAAIDALSELAHTIPGDDENRPALLVNLGIALRARRNEKAGVDDLGKAVEAMREAVLLTSTSNPKLVDCLEHLISTLQIRFADTGSSSDLDEIIEVGRRIMILADDDADVGSSLDILADALDVRSERTGSLDDLDDMVDVYRRIVEITSATDPSMPAKLSNLGASFYSKYSRSDLSSDLEMAVEIGRFAILIASPDDPHRGVMLWSLSNALHDMWRRSGKEKLLNETVKRRREALAGTPEDSSYRAIRLQGLSDILLASFGHSLKISDIDESVQLARQAIAFTPFGSRVRGDALVQLRRALQARLDHAGATVDREELVSLDRFTHHGDAVLSGSAANLVVNHALEINDRVPAASAGPVVRGVVIGGHSSLTEGGGYSLSGTNVCIPAAALYWDKLAWTYGNGMGQHGMGEQHEEGLRIVVGLDPAAKELKDLKHLEFTRNDVYQPSWDPKTATVDHGRILGVPIDEFVALEDVRIDSTALEFNDRYTGESWSAGHVFSEKVTNAVSELADLDAPRSSALLLTIALPVPSPDMPIATVLEFRRCNHGYLTAFHDALADLVHSTAADAGGRLEDLQRRLAEISRLLGQECAQRWARTTQIVLGVGDETWSANSAAFLEAYRGKSTYAPYAGSLPKPTLDQLPLLSLFKVSRGKLLPNRVTDFYYLFAEEPEVIS
jgi:hypothetical protein